MVWLPDEYKLDGMIFSTIIGFLFIQIPWETHVVFRDFFGPGYGRVYCRSHAVFAAFALALCLVTWRVAAFVTLGGVRGLLAKGALAAAVSGALVLAVFRNEVAALARRRFHPSAGKADR